MRLALLPDARWGLGEAAPVDSKILLDGTVSTGSGSVSFRFWFRVTGSAADGWGGMDHAARWLVVVLMAAAVTGAILWWG